MIDLTKGSKEFVVPTSIVRDGVAYMGPDVKVTARDASHAKEVASGAGHQPNPNFGLREVKPSMFRPLR